MATDGELLRQWAAERSEESFAVLLRRHGPMVLASCRRLVGQEAEDAAQAVFILLARKAGKLSGEREIGPWLYRACGFVARAMRRERSRRQVREREAAVIRATADRGEGQGAGGESLASQASRLKPELDRELDAALSELPERFRKVVVLCHLEGVTQEEAARRLGVPLSTVANRSARALEKLREKLARRKVELGSAAALGALLAEGAARAAEAFAASNFLPSALAASKLAVTGTAAAAGGLSWSLAEGAAKMMFWAKTAKLAVGMLAATVAIGCAAAPMAAYALGGKEKPAPEPRLADIRILPAAPADGQVEIAAKPAEATDAYEAADQVVRLRLVKAEELKDDRRRYVFEVSKILKGEPVKGPVVALAPGDKADELKLTIGGGATGRMELNKALKDMLVALKPGNELIIALKHTTTTTTMTVTSESKHSSITCTSEHGYYEFEYDRERDGSRKPVSLRRLPYGKESKLSNGWTMHPGNAYENPLAREGADRLAPAKQEQLKQLDAQRSEKAKVLDRAYAAFSEDCRDEALLDKAAAAFEDYQKTADRLRDALLAALEEALGASYVRPLDISLDMTTNRVSVKGANQAARLYCQGFLEGHVVLAPSLQEKIITLDVKEKSWEEYARLLADAVGGHVVKKDGKWRIEPGEPAGPGRPEQF